MKRLDDAGSGGGAGAGAAASAGTRKSTNGPATRKPASGDAAARKQAPRKPSAAKLFAKEPPVDDVAAARPSAAGAEAVPRVHAAPPFPFSAIVGQEEMKRAILVAAIDPSLGGVLVFGDRGTGKSTAVRGLAALLPSRRVVTGCPYGCDPSPAARHCEACAAVVGTPACRTEAAPIPVVDLPLGASEDRVVGALDLERALTRG